MATIPYSGTPLPEPGDPPVWSFSWGPMAQNDTGVAVPDIWNYADRSVQIEGVFGGASLLLEGSNDGTNYETLNDPQGVALSVSSASIKAVTEVCHYVRPRVSGGGGTTALTVTLLARRTTPRL